jgi:outer membrane receptor protein involved in Fe transport
LDASSRNIDTRSIFSNGEARLVRGSIWLGAAIFACTAHAQSSSDALDEVVVSARKRTEKAQDVPISMSVRSGETLADDNTFRMQEILRSMPNVSTEIQQPRQTSIVIRGLGKNPANDGLEASVGIFLDGVYLGRSGMATNDLIDVERIEVLRGPQGVLFGKNTTAGALNIVTRAPGEEFETWAQVSLGNDDFSQLSGAISAPLVPRRLSFRLSAFDTNRTGFVFDDSPIESLRESLVALALLSCRTFSAHWFGLLNYRLAQTLPATPVALHGRPLQFQSHAAPCKFSLLIPSLFPPVHSLKNNNQSALDRRCHSEYHSHDREIVTCILRLVSQSPSREAHQFFHPAR